MNVRWRQSSARTEDIRWNRSNIKQTLSHTPHRLDSGDISPRLKAIQHTKSTLHGVFSSLRSLNPTIRHHRLSQFFRSRLEQLMTNRSAGCDAVLWKHAQRVIRGVVHPVVHAIVFPSLRLIGFFTPYSVLQYLRKKIS